MRVFCTLCGARKTIDPASYIKGWQHCSHCRSEYNSLYNSVTHHEGKIVFVVKEADDGKETR